MIVCGKNATKLMLKFVKDDMKTTIQPILNEFRTGNLMSPAMTALHEQLVQVRDLKFFSLFRAFR